MRRSSALATLLVSLPALSLSARAQDEPAADASSGVAGEVLVAPPDDYPTLDALHELFRAWASQLPEHVRVVDLGQSRGRRAIPALEIGYSPEDATPRPSRPTVFLVGGLDGTSLVGGVAAVRAAHMLLSELGGWGSATTVVVVPWGSPDGLARTLESRGGGGGNDRPVDDDFDGAVDEDGPDDVDQDGLVLEMLVEDPDGPWTPSSDERFLVEAREGDSPRYRRLPEGRDDDGDGRFNEDPPGGVVLDQSFPLGWVGPPFQPRQGELPLDEPAARRLAEEIMARDTICVVHFSGAEGLRWPTGMGQPENEGLRSALTAAYHNLVGPEDATTSSAIGAGGLVEWAGGVLGVVACEVGAWGPRVASSLVGAAEEPVAAETRRRPPSSEDRAWRRWLDNNHGGLGFRPWQEVELGGGVRALVGGWEPRTHLNPGQVDLRGVSVGPAAFARTLIGALPVLEAQAVEIDRRGELCRLVVRLQNQGRLPTGREGIEVTLSAPGWRVLAEPGGTRLVDLEGGAVSAPLEWLLIGSKGTPLFVEASSSWAPSARKELRP